MVKYVKEFGFAVLAGMAISVGGGGYLSVQDPGAGAGLWGGGLGTVLGG